MEVATQSLLTATDAMAAHMAIPNMASDIVMPTAESLAAMNVTGIQHTTTVEQIVADALHGGNAPSIDALLDSGLDAFVQSVRASERGLVDIAVEQVRNPLLRDGEVGASGLHDRQRTGAQAVVDGWLASPGHCANIMNRWFTEMGSAYAVAGL